MKGRCSLRPKSVSPSPAANVLNAKKKGRTFMGRKKRLDKAASGAQRGVLGTHVEKVGSPLSAKGTGEEKRGSRGADLTVKVGAGRRDAGRRARGRLPAGAAPRSSIRSVPLPGQSLPHNSG